MPDFFSQPVLNSPYEFPARHWELDEDNQPTQDIVEKRRKVAFITPIPKSRRKGDNIEQRELILDEGAGISDEQQQFDLTSIINEVRRQVDTWRTLAKAQWGVTPDTARLLDYWRNHDFSSIRPFFCQLEAVETAIWLTEVAPALPSGKKLLTHLKEANEDANPGLNRLALKLATGAGKTTVMAMLIAWQTINAVRRSNSKLFTNGFLIVAPGLTIKDRLRVLQPNDPENYYTTRELLPAEYFGDIKKARIVRRIPVLKARMNADLHMAGDLKNTNTANLFVIFGEPDIEVFQGDSTHLAERRNTWQNEITTRESQTAKLEESLKTLKTELKTTKDKTAKEEKETLLANLKSQLAVAKSGLTRRREMLADTASVPSGQLVVRIHGIDVFDPKKGEVRSDNTDGIACWMIDTDYNGESFFVRHAYFLGQNDPYKSLKTTLKAEINEEAWQTLHSATSRPFDPPPTSRIAVKAINHLGDEVMKVFRLKN